MPKLIIRYMLIVSVLSCYIFHSVSKPSIILAEAYYNFFLLVILFFSDLPRSLRMREHARIVSVRLQERLQERYWIHGVRR